jgi:pilus assembly protein CpaC
VRLHTNTGLTNSRLIDGLGSAIAATVLLLVGMSLQATAQDAIESVTQGSPAPIKQSASGPVVIAMPPSITQASILDITSVPGTLDTVTRAATGANMLHVTVGHSIYVDAKTRLKRVYVADPTILNSVCLTPTEIIVTAMAPGISSLTLLDETGKSQSYVVSSDIDIDGLRTAMAQETRGNAVKVEGTGARVTLSGIVGSDAEVDSALKLAGLYSKEVSNALTVTPVHPKQVRLQVRILEVDRTKALQLGINLFNPGGNTSFLAGTTTSQYPSTMTYTSGQGNVGGGSVLTTNPLNFMLYSAKLNLGATIQDLESKQVLQVLAEPTISTISGEKADFLSGGEFPFPVVQASSGTNSAPIVTISFRPYGVKVEFTPVVNEDGTIRLKVAPEVSALDYTNAVTISGFTVPALSTRRASTEVELRSEQSFAISGLLDQRTTDIMSKDPGIASIPILGYLFKSKNATKSTTELVIVVTPTLVDPLVETAPPSQPDMPVNTLNIPAYDKALGANHNPAPAAPPVTPDEAPRSIPPVFPKTMVAPAAAPTAAKATTAKPARTPRSATPQPTSGIALASASTPGRTNASVAAISSAQVPSTPTLIASGASMPINLIQPSQTGKPQQPSKIEIMTLSHQSDAEAMVSALNRRGYNVTVDHDSETSLLHLDIGPFNNSGDAEKMRLRLLSDGYDAIVK